MNRAQSFQANQNLFAYEEDGVPRLLQVIDARTLQTAIEWNWEEGGHFLAPDRYHDQIPFVFYCLPDASSCDGEAIFFSKLRSYTCMILSRSEKRYVWSNARSLEKNEPEIIDRLSDWELYRSLETSQQLFAVAIDEHRAIAPRTRIGQEWPFSKSDLEHLNLHDLLFYLCSPQKDHVPLGCMSEDVRKEWLRDINNKVFLASLICLGEDLLCSCFETRSAKRMYQAIIERIAPLQELLPEELFKKPIDIEAFLAFLKDIRPGWTLTPYEQKQLTPLIDEVCHRLESCHWSSTRLTPVSGGI